MLEENVLNAISNNRKNLAIVGSNLGGQFHQVDVRPSIPNFDDEASRIASEGNVELFFNRTPKRYRMVSRDIINIGTKADVTNQPIVYINQDENGLSEVQIPFSSDMNEFASINDNALKEAIKGDKSKIFADPDKLVPQLNAINNKEIRNIEHLEKILGKIKKQIEDTIAENNRKVITYKRELGLGVTDDAMKVKVDIDLSSK